MIRWLPYSLGVFFAATLIVNLATRDGSESFRGLGLLSVTAVAIVMKEWRGAVQRRPWQADLDVLGGLDNCPISPDQLCELFKFLNRSNPSPYNHRFSESIQILQDRGLETEPTLKWLNANGAGCDIEVIYNTAQRCGPNVRFEQGDAFEN